MKIAECLKAPPNTKIPILDAIITKVDQPKAFTGKDGKPGTRVVVTMQDDTGQIRYCYFNPPKVPEMNDVIRVTNGLVKAAQSAGYPNEIGLSLYPDASGQKGSIVTLGKGTAPPMAAPVQAAPQDAAAALFGVASPAPAPQPQPQPQPVVYQPQPQPQPVVYQPQPQAPQTTWPLNPAPQPQIQPQIPAQAPEMDDPDFNSGQPSTAQAMLTVAENLITINNTLINGFAGIQSGLQAIFEELNHEGLEIESKFDQVYLRLIKVGKKPEEIFATLQKKIVELAGLGDHKTSIIAIAADWNVDISDLF